MSRVKEIDRLCNEIADELSIHPDMVNLSQVVGGWLADINLDGDIIEARADEPIDALNKLLNKCQKV